MKIQGPGNREVIGDGRVTHPEHLLVSAVVQRALLDVQSMDAKNRETAADWIFDEFTGPDNPFSLAWCCEQLTEGDGAWMRKAVQGAAIQALRDGTRKFGRVGPYRFRLGTSSVTDSTVSHCLSVLRQCGEQFKLQKGWKSSRSTSDSSMNLSPSSDQSSASRI